MASSRWSLDSSDWKKILHAMLWSGASSALVAVPVVSQLNVSTIKAAALMVAVAFVNGALVALKKLLEDKGELSLSSLKKQKM